jgi:BirA family biotin operon repressor/biotin-[acetyl-CoA-carboxylase] ligase
MGALMRNQAYSRAHSNARDLRANMTDSERKLWSKLRAEQLGVKFRRQHPLGNYIADFACLSPKLIVELDGSQHAARATYDAHRERFFRDHGFEVLRFATDEPLRNMDGVLAVIVEQLGLTRERPHPNPPPEGEGVNTRKQP